jgi:hypothetical protein
MKLLHHTLLGWLLYATGSTAAPWRVTATNPLPKTRLGEIVEIPIRSSQPHTNRSIGPVSQWQVWSESSHQEIISQTVDQDDDGRLDLLLIQADFGPLESKTFLIQPGLSPLKGDPQRTTFGRFVPERMDDFAWENDLVAFRMYGPALAREGGGSGVDCWLKRVPYPIINKWYELALQGISYHQDHGEGYDPYHVGASRGCGGLSYQINGEIISTGVFVTHRLIANGPLRTEFELTYKTSTRSGSMIDETKRVAIDLGSRLTRFDIAIKGVSPEQQMDLLLGLNTHEGKAHVQLAPEAGYMSAWELMDDAHLGTGIVAFPSTITKAEEWRSSNRDSAHGYLFASYEPDQRFRYYAGYGWTKAMGITSEEAWIDYLRNIAANIQNPILVTITKTNAQGT